MFLGLLCATKRGRECLIFKYPKSTANVFLKIEDGDRNTVASCINCRKIYRSLTEEEKIGTLKPATIPVVNGCYFEADPSHAIHLPGCSPSPFDTAMERFDLATAKSPPPPSRELPAYTTGRGLDEDRELLLEKDEEVRGEETNTTVPDQESSVAYSVEICKATSVANPMLVYKFKNDANEWKCYRFTVKRLTEWNDDMDFHATCTRCMAIYRKAWRRKSSLSAPVRTIVSDGRRLFTDPHSIHVPGCLPFAYDDVIEMYPLATAEVRERFLYGEDGSKDDCESKPVSISSSRKKRRCTLATPSYKEDVADADWLASLGCKDYDDDNVDVEQSFDVLPVNESNTLTSKSVDASVVGSEEVAPPDYPVKMCAPTNWSSGNPIFLYKFENYAGEWKCYRFNAKAVYQKFKSCTLFRATCSGCICIYNQEIKRDISLHVNTIKSDGRQFLSDPHANHLPGCCPLDYNDIITNYPLVTEEVKEMIIQGKAVRLHNLNMLRPGQRKELKVPYGSNSVNKLVPIKRSAKGGSEDDCESTRSPTCVAPRRKKRRCTLFTPSYADKDGNENIDDSGQFTKLRCEGLDKNDVSLNGCEDMELGDDGVGNAVQSADNMSTTPSSSAEVTNTQKSVAIGYALIKEEPEEIGSSHFPPSVIPVALAPSPRSAPITINEPSTEPEPVRRIQIVPPTTFKKKFDALVFTQDEVEVTVVEGRLLVVRFEKKTSTSDDEQSSLLYKVKLPDHVDIDSLTSNWKNGSLVVRAYSKAHHQ